MTKMLTAALANLTPRFRFKLLQPCIDNIAFKLHYKLTVTVLIAFVILVCSREYFGDHIRCLSDNGVPDNVIQTYCFFMATFTIVRHYNESLLQTGFLPHPGVGPLAQYDEILHHTYYQWVPFVLFLQAIFFYMPHYIWKKKEGGRIKALVDGLQYATLALEDNDMTVNGKLVPSKTTLQNKLDTIRKDIILRLRITRTWSTWLVAMEVANLIHVILEIWIINKLLNGHFLGLGLRILGFENWNQINDPLETVFPKVTKCVFHKYGPSGSIQQHDALCVMALNIVHEKIYTVLWFWLLFLFIISLIAVIWRFVSFYMYRRSLMFNEMIFRRVSNGKFNPYNVIRIVNGCKYGDWLFLYYLAKNMNGIIFQELFVRLAEELEKRDHPPEKSDKNKPTEPVSVVDYNDETLPLKDDKKLEST